MKTFVMEYANQKKGEFSKNSLMRADVRKTLITKIDHAVDLFGRNYITLDECVKIISAVGNREIKGGAKKNDN